MLELSQTPLKFIKSKSFIMDKSVVLSGIQFVIEHAKSVSKATKRGEEVPGSKESGVTIDSLFSICLEKSIQYKTYGVKFGANVGKSKKHFRLQIDSQDAKDWNNLIFAFMQMDSISATPTFNIKQALADSI